VNLFIVIISKWCSFFVQPLYNLACEIDLRSVPIPLPTTRPPSGRPPVATKSTPTIQPQPGARVATKAPLERTSTPSKTTIQERNPPLARSNSNLTKSQVGFLFNFKQHVRVRKLGRFQFSLRKFDQHCLFVIVFYSNMVARTNCFKCI
jgi:hypothetical protein